MSKRKSKPTDKKRSVNQRIKDRYAHAREDAQLAGLIPTTPEESLKNEVAPEGADPPQVALINQAIRNGWAVPEASKPKLVDELMSIINNPEMPAKVKTAAFNALRMADQQQYERDYPELASRAKGGSTSIENNIDNSSNTNTNTNTLNTMTNVFNDIQMLEDSILRIIGDDEPDSEANSNIRAYGDAQPLDEEESDISQEEQETD